MRALDPPGTVRLRPRSRWHNVLLHATRLSEWG